MVFNMGAFSEGKNENDQRRRAQRKDNAALYADFVRMNPDSSVGDREGFVKNLTGSDSKFVRATMPTRSVMEANVARRKSEVGAAAKTRKLQLLKQQMSFMNDAANMYSNSYLANGDEKAAAAGLSMFDEILTPEMQSAAASQGQQTAIVKFDEKMQPYWDAWKEGGATAEGMKNWGDLAPNEAMIQKWKNRATNLRGQLGQQEFIQAQEQIQAVGSANDAARLDQFKASLPQKYSHLDDQQIASIISGVDSAFTQAGVTANNAIEAEASAIIAGIVAKAKTSVNTNGEGGTQIIGLQNRDAIQEEIQSQFDQNPLINRAPTDAEIANIAQTVDEMQQGIIAQLDGAEIKAKDQILQQSEREDFRYNPQLLDSNGQIDIDELNKQENAALSALDRFVERQSGTGQTQTNEAAVDRKKVMFTEKFADAVRVYGINISDPNVYLNMLSTTARSHAADGIIEFDELHFLNAVHEQLGKDMVSNEGVAYNLALQEMGVTSVADFMSTDLNGDDDALKFRAEFEKQRVARITSLTDLYDKSRTSLTDVSEQVAGTISTTNADTQLLTESTTVTEVDTLVAGGVIQNIAQIDSLQQRQNQIQTVVIDNAVKLDKIDQDIRSAEAYLKIPQFANDPDLQPERAQVLASIDELKASRSALVDQITILDGAADKLDVPVALATTDVGNKTVELRQFAADVIAYQINSFGLDPSNVEAAAREMAEGAWPEVDTVFVHWGDDELRGKKREMDSRDKWIDKIVEMVTAPPNEN